MKKIILFLLIIFISSKIQSRYDHSQKEGDAVINQMLACRSFGEDLRNDITSIMPYFGLLDTIQLINSEAYGPDKRMTLEKLKIFIENKPLSNQLNPNLL